ncbi:MAG: hypothetical protein ACK451_16445 [Pseudanabaena sp.]|jgi:hypothetical protein
MIPATIPRCSRFVTFISVLIPASSFWLFSNYFTLPLRAECGFEHGELIRWLQQNQWSWAIRAKSDLLVTLPTGTTKRIEQLIPPPEQAYLVPDVTVLGDVNCHLATANLDMANGSWAVLSDIPPSLQTFAFYGKRFGGIEPHFKDY